MSQEAIDTPRLREHIRKGIEAAFPKLAVKLTPIQWAQLIASVITAIAQIVAQFFGTGSSESTAAAAAAAAAIKDVPSWSFTW